MDLLAAKGADPGLSPPFGGPPFRNPVSAPVAHTLYTDTSSQSGDRIRFDTEAYSAASSLGVAQLRVHYGSWSTGGRLGLNHARMSVSKSEGNGFSFGFK